MYLKDANGAGLFSVLCVDTPDISLNEQISIVLRLVKKKLFMKFLWDLKNSTQLLGKELPRNCFEA